MWPALIRAEELYRSGSPSGVYDKELEYIDGKKLENIWSSERVGLSAHDRERFTDPDLLPPKKIMFDRKGNVTKTVLGAYEVQINNWLLEQALTDDRWSTFLVLAREITPSGLVMPAIPIDAFSYFTQQDRSSLIPQLESMMQNALTFMHKAGFYHGDIKPENIGVFVLVQESQTDRANAKRDRMVINTSMDSIRFQLFDFDLSSIRSDTLTVAQSWQSGSRHYHSPEPIGVVHELREILHGERQTLTLNATDATYWPWRRFNDWWCSYVTLVACKTRSFPFPATVTASACVMSREMVARPEWSTSKRSVLNEHAEHVRVHQPRILAFLKEFCEAKFVPVNVKTYVSTQSFWSDAWIDALITQKRRRVE